MANVLESLGVNRAEYLEEWATRSKNSELGAVKALKHFDAFLESLKTSEATMLKELRGLDNTPQFYLFLNKFIKFLEGRKLHPHSISTYFMFIKHYLRANGFRIYNEDVKQYARLPKPMKEPKAAIEMDDIAKAYNASPKWIKAVISCLTSSGMRIGELLQLRVCDIEGNKVTIRAENTKTKAQRTTFLSKQALKDISKYLRNRQPTAYVFVSKWQPVNSTLQAEKEFDKVRRKVRITDKYRLSNVHFFTLHRLRAFCKTQASNLHGKDFAEMLIGHEGYLSTYYAISEKEKARTYKELEPKLTIPESNPKRK